MGGLWVVGVVVIVDSWVVTAVVMVVAVMVVAGLVVMGVMGVMGDDLWVPLVQRTMTMMAKGRQSTSGPPPDCY